MRGTEILVATFPHAALVFDSGSVGKSYLSWLGDDKAPHQRLFISTSPSTKSQPEEYLLNAVEWLFSTRDVRVVATGPNEVFQDRAKHDLVLDMVLGSLSLHTELQGDILHADAIALEASPVSMRSVFDVIGTTAGVAAISAGPGIPFALFFLAGRGIVALWRNLPETQEAVDRGVSGWVKNLIATSSQKQKDTLERDVELLKLELEKKRLEQELREVAGAGKEQTERTST